MKREWVQDYDKALQSEQKLYLKGQTSTSFDIKVACDFAFNDLSDAKIPVLFFYTIQNYDHFLGVRLNDEAFSAYPCEGEIVLMEGCIVYVVGIEELEIKNDSETFKEIWIVVSDPTRFFPGSDTILTRI